MVNEHRPDEKGIATHLRLAVRLTKAENEHRPDEKGIATSPSMRRSARSIVNEHRPDEKGIATLLKAGTSSSGLERTQT